VLRTKISLALVAVFVVGSIGCAHPSRFPLYAVDGDQFALTAAPPDPPAPPAIEGNTDRERFDALVADWRARLGEAGVPGGAIAVVVDGKLAFAAGVGVTGAGGHDAVTPDTQFRLASNTKLLVAIALLREVDDGRVALDAPASTYLPWLRGPLAAVTPAMLLSHTSGLWRGGEDGDLCPAGDDGLRAYFGAHAGDPLWAPPGRLYSYSNAGFALAAAIVSATSGRSFEDAITDGVLRPAGMTHATFEPAIAARGDHAIGRSLESGADVSLSDRDCPVFRAAGGVITSVTDEAHLLEVLLAGGAPLLSPASAAALVADRVEVGGVPTQHYAFGIGASDYKGLRMLSHAGRTSGFGSFVALVPERRFGVIAMVDVDRIPSGVALRALDALLGLAPGLPPRTPAPPATWDRYVGSYRDASGELGHVTIARDPAGLVMTLDDGGALPADLDVTFVRGADGNAEYLVTPAGIAKRDAP